MMKFTTVLLALATAMPLAPAQAQIDDRISIAVHHADLDLSHDAGRRTLDHRIRIAAKAACGMPSATDATGEKKARQCRDEVIARTAFHRQQVIAAAARPRAQELAAQ